MTARARDPQDASGPTGGDVERGTGAPAAGSREAALAHADFWAERWKVQADRSVRLYKALREVEKHCPCGARPESPTTHPHVGGCPVGEALWNDAPAPAEAAEAAPEGDVERVVRADALADAVQTFMWCQEQWADEQSGYTAQTLQQAKNGMKAAWRTYYDAYVAPTPPAAPGPGR